MWYIGASILIVGIIFFILKEGLSKGARLSLFLLLIEYFVLLYSFTVFFRPTDSTVNYDLTPFWSYRVYYWGDEPQLLYENIMNMAVFIPVGLFLGLVSKKNKLWQVLVIGSGVSVSIEILQFVLKRGFAEVDDVMHNTAGCFLGYGMYLMICRIWLLFKG